MKRQILKYILLICTSNHPAIINLQEMVQKFVLETKQILINEYPHAFNPSIIYWNNEILMSFRVIPNPEDAFNAWIGIVRLDINFTPIGTAQRIYAQVGDLPIPSRVDDARLVICGKHLYLVYSGNPEIMISKGGFRMYIAELLWDGKNFFIQNNECLSSFEGNNKRRREKNWVPFNYANELLLAYSIKPHRILRPIRTTSYCETFAYSNQSIEWNWGILRGGTPALLDDDNYLAFFHSSKKMVTVQSKGQEILHYFIGAYTFSKHPPFSVTKISAVPIVAESFYTGAEYEPYWKPVQVVFPCGFIFDKNYIWLAYGKQDHEIWIAKLDKKKLYESLMPVS